MRLKSILQWKDTPIDKDVAVDSIDPGKREYGKELFKRLRVKARITAAFENEHRSRTLGHTLTERRLEAQIRLAFLEDFERMRNLGSVPKEYSISSQITNVDHNTLSGNLPSACTGKQ